MMGLTQWIAELFAGSSAWWGVAAFVAGLALNLTPCVYPLIPVTLAFFSNQASGRVGYAVWLGLLYVLGISLTYATLGLVAAKTGALFGSWLQHPAVLIILAGILIGLALSLFGLYELRLPGWVSARLGRASSGSVGAFLMGLSVGVVAAPCIGPVMVGVLALVSQLADPWRGFWVLFLLGCGMGAPYLVIGVAAHRLARWPASGPWLLWTKKVLGVLVIGLALSLLRPLVSLSALRAGSAEPPATAARIRWQPYTAARLAQAQQDGKPALVDVYADWCVPCVELDHVTFRHPDVMAKLAAFSTLRVDATRSVSAEAQALLDRYDIYGVPTVLVFDRDGRERPELRVTGFVTPEEFLEQLRKLSP